MIDPDRDDDATDAALSHRWERLVGSLGLLGPRADGIGATARRRLAEPHRKYHTGRHVLALLDHLDDARAVVSDAAAVALAVWFHDIVYDARCADNESDSALVFAEAAIALGLDLGIRLAVDQMILATTKHAPPPGAAQDLRLFLDLDLSILGATPTVYDAYVEAVRKEYAHVADDAWRVGRRGVLERFAARSQIYFTAHGASRWEKQARANLAREITALG